jgi:serine/threonine-protein kinase
LWRWSRRKPAAAGLVVMVVAMVGFALGGGLWLERQRAEQRAERARNEGRASQAVEAALEKAADLQLQGRWPETLAVLGGAQRLLGDSSPAHLVDRVRRARADASMVADLEDIRLRMSASSSSENGSVFSPELAYAGAFEKYGIPVLSLEPDESAARIRASAIRETLVAYLHDWLYWVSDENKARLVGVLGLADDDDWRSAYREARVANDIEELRRLAQHPEAPMQPSVVVSGLGGAMLADRYKNETLALLQKAQQRNPGDFWINFLLGNFWLSDRPQEAVGYFRVAVAIRPTSDAAWLNLGRVLRDSGNVDEAIAAFRRSVDLNPNFDVARELKTCLVQKGGLDEARAAWEKLLELNPADHGSWYGYAEFCLFLGREDDYRRARRDLLARFGATTNPFDAERTARACLLMPAGGDELRQAISIAERAVAEREGDKWGHPYFEFVRGLAHYRQGRYAQAIAMMQGDAAGVLGPAPCLVLAMARHQSGALTEARETLATAVLSHDWRAVQTQVRDQNGWIYHILRREAENLILPNLSAFMSGEYQPQDNAERLSLLGVCQAANHTRAIARLYADAFTSAPALADDLEAGHRYNAARAAALAGCGRGEDATALDEQEARQWRDQARSWLRSELIARAGIYDADPKAGRGSLRLTLTRWQSDPDLVSVRDPGEIEELSADERNEYLALWADVAALLDRTEK